jgi:tyrosinase
MTRNGRTYLPIATTPGAQAAHRIDTPIQSPFGGSATPAQVLNLSSVYTYDTLSV